MCKAEASVRKNGSNQRSIMSGGQAREMLESGLRQAPYGYCRRCWRSREAMRGSPMPSRCDEHHEQIEQQARERENALARSRNEIDTADMLFTAMKWLARITGAYSKSASDGLTEVVDEAFYSALPERTILTQAEVDVAFDAALLAFERWSGEEAVVPACPCCGNRRKHDRQGNSFRCSECGFETNVFGAAHLMGAVSQRLS